jgi:hypothetical protein
VARPAQDRRCHGRRPDPSPRRRRSPMTQSAADLPALRVPGRWPHRSQTRPSSTACSPGYETSAPHCCRRTPSRHHLYRASLDRWPKARKG